MKIHLGCGKHILDGYTNCDAVKHTQAPRQPDILCDVKSVPLPDQCADEVLAVHILEHFYRWEVEAVLAEWRRLLKPNGLLVLELPDIKKAARLLLEDAPDKFSMWPLYGDPSWKDPLMCHRWGWTHDTLKPVLLACGFTGIIERNPQWHGRKVKRDMRLEARRNG